MESLIFEISTGELLSVDCALTHTYINKKKLVVSDFIKQFFFQTYNFSLSIVLSKILYGRALFSKGFIYLCL